MKLSYIRDLFDNRSVKASDIARQLGLAGIAVIWIFKADSKTRYSLPVELYKPLYLFCFGLLSDLFQYIYASIAWGIVLSKSGKQNDDDEVNVPGWINVPTWSLFVAKIVFLLIGYYFLLLFVIGRV
jgi:hypothetical protein